MAANLAPVFLDDNRIRLQGEPRPKVSEILTAGGRQPGQVQVVRLKSQGDAQGKSLRPDEVIDRTQESGSPVYLKVVEKGGASGSPAMGGGRGTTAFETEGAAMPGGGRGDPAGFQSTRAYPQESAPRPSTPPGEPEWNPPQGGGNPRNPRKGTSDEPDESA